jgi:sporulation protein YlmC with PRC-barrel domain
LKGEDVRMRHLAEMDAERFLTFLGFTERLGKTIKLYTCTYLTKRRMNMAKQEKAVTKDMLVSMTVVDSDGRSVGTVRDVAFVVGKMGLSLRVENKKGEGRDVSWEEVQAVGDFVVLKPARAQILETQTPKTCPTCGGPLRYIEQYQRWWCDRDRKYV